MAEAKFYLMTDSPCDFTQQMVDDANIGMFHFTYTEAGKEAASTAWTTSSCPARHTSSMRQSGTERCR